LEYITWKVIQVERAVIEQMVTTLAHRGPDGAGVWNEGCVGLGHRMLWTTPESLHETLPLLNKAREVAITADARIDNRDELLEALNIRSELQGEVTDSQLILAAYIKWGEDCPQHLLGDFSFVIWDGHKQQLFCARDHFGVKPFYYHYTAGKRFAFATEIKALLGLPDVPRHLNEVRVAEHLLELNEDPAITLYQDILRLPAAHCMTVSRKGVQQQRYWSLDATRELRLGSDEEYAQKFLEIFTEAVRCRLRSAFPVGSTLSGGLDSSSIVCVARKLLREEVANSKNEKDKRNLRTYSVVYDVVTQCDERPWINAVLNGGDLEPHYVHGDQVSPLNDSERFLWHEDQAVYGGNFRLVWSLHGLAGKTGTRIFLEGFDGDTVVSHGFRYLEELARGNHWITLTKQARGWVKNFGGYDSEVDYSASRVVWAYVNKYKLDPIVNRVLPLRVVRRAWRGVVGKKGPASKKPINQLKPENLLNPKFVERINLPQLQAEHRRQAQLRNPLHGVQSDRSDHVERLNHPRLPHFFEVEDASAGAFSVEPRFPFFDKRLVEFCLSLPGEQKMSEGWTRMIVRRAMKGVLPEEIRWRGGKTNLYASFKHTLLNLERERLEDLLNKTDVFEDFVNTAAVREALLRAPQETAPSSDVNTIWRAASLALWLQHTGLTSRTSTNKEV
jgi:asparagine synthase (glutamine-hydrolysing)